MKNTPQVPTKDDDFYTQISYADVWLTHPWYSQLDLHLGKLEIFEKALLTGAFGEILRYLVEQIKVRNIVGNADVMKFVRDQTLVIQAMTPPNQWDTNSIIQRVRILSGRSIWQVNQKSIEGLKAVIQWLEKTIPKIESWSIIGIASVPFVLASAKHRMASVQNHWEHQPSKHEIAQKSIEMIVWAMVCWQGLSSDQNPDNKKKYIKLLRWPVDLNGEGFKTIQGAIGKFTVWQSPLSQQEMLDVYNIARYLASIQIEYIQDM